MRSYKTPRCVAIKQAAKKASRGKQCSRSSTSACRVYCTAHCKVACASDMMLHTVATLRTPRHRLSETDKQGLIYHRGVPGFAPKGM